MTPKQRKCLDFIDQYWSDNGYAPSFDEIRVALNLKSKSGVADVVTKLEERGFVERTPNLARSLRVVMTAPPPAVEYSETGPAPQPKAKPKPKIRRVKPAQERTRKKDTVAANP